jgi:YjbE family integral membrane protein
MEQLTPEHISSAFSIVLINLILSGDNAVVIGMAAHRLAPAQRKVAIAFGGFAAVVLRILLTTIAALLLQVPGLRAIGALLLIWIAFHLLELEEESHEGAKVPTDLRGAIFTILVADIVMSIDNVLGVAAASHGNVVLLVFGLVASMAILMFMGGLLAGLIDKFWWLAYVGSGVIAWTGATMIFEDPVIEAQLGTVPAEWQIAISALVTVLTLIVAHWFHRVRPRSPAIAKTME